MFERSFGLVSTQMLGAIARYGVADLLEQGPLTAAEIAAKTKTHPDVMHRTLRALATTGVFELRADGTFRNNRLSRVLCTNNTAGRSAWFKYFASGANVAAWRDFERTLVTGDISFDHAHGVTMWEWLDRHPTERETFANAMVELTTAAGPMLAVVYPFGEIRRICDVGGGRGTLLSEILVRHPDLHGVLYDGPGVIASARDFLAGRGVLDRVETIAGSFFDSVPGGCDAYLMKHILHDWDDAHCRKILASCRRAMAVGARLLVIESITERFQTDGLSPIMDLHMLVALGGRERSREDYEHLLRAEGFGIERVFSSPIGDVIEARAR
ncbi:methyltransferase [Sorangium sp. So ce448]|uniref:methyltransferase n=1 Tax=Sorangium sp. So ce448 TaxID=3133314 RepID=UPI003F5E2C70